MRQLIVVGLVIACCLAFALQEKNGKTCHRKYIAGVMPIGDVCERME